MTSDRYFRSLAAAFVRGKLGLSAAGSATTEAHAEEEKIAAGLEAGLRLHKFKANAELPRVRKAIGIARGLAPTRLLDLGSGRGTFLWPFLEGLPEVPVTALDRSARRACDLQAVRAGGIGRLTVVRGDLHALPFADGSFDGVTALEVLEHLPQPESAAREIVRVARRFAVVSVPSKEDTNPEHLHLLTKERIERMFREAGASRIAFDGVLNHLFAVVRLGAP